jgi:hypothetical protein
MKLPNGDQAQIDDAKLRDYCLNPAHPRGRHKARVFARALGVTIGDLELLRSRLLTAAAEGEATRAGQDEFGDRFVIDFLMEGTTGQAFVRSSWIIRAGETSPRLISCYVL